MQNRVVAIKLKHIDILSILKNIVSLYFLVLFPALLQAQIQEQPTTACEPKTILELFKKKDSTNIVKPVKDNFFLIIPIIGSQPATGFAFGGVAQYTFKGKNVNDKYSIANLGVVYTTKKQLLVNVKNNVLLKNNKIFLSGDYRLYLFSQPNYGLGTGIIPSRKTNSNFDIGSIREPMDYNYFKFHQSLSWSVKNNFYVGAGLNLDWYSSIQDKNLDVENGQFTDHYNYSQKYGFDNLEYFLNGVSLNLVHDSRDNQVNAHRGWYANINYRFNPYLFNNQRYSNVLYTEYRHFIPVSKKNDNYVFAIWAYGQFITRGQVPYLNLPAIGWDQRSRSGEGYEQGLFRGENLVYLSTEFRFPLTCNQMIGATVFTNFITTSSKNTNVALFDYIQPAAGIGLRILIDKTTRTNLIVDYGWGNKSEGFYLNAGETF